MKLKLSSAVHSENGLVLHVIGETPEEEEVLRAMWKHGKMEMLPAGVQSGYGCCVTWNMREPKP